MKPRSFERLAPLLSLLLLPALASGQNEAPSDLQETRQRLQNLEERLGKLEGAPAKASLSAFNPAMGLALDLAGMDKNDKAGFQFRAAELGIEAPIDPFLKGWAIFTGSNGNPSIDVEEAALETTCLPNWTIRGGRLFASFGRLAHFHDHELPLTERPKSLDEFVGGETRADGVEASYLFPTDTYISAVFGMYDKMGASNNRVDPAGSRPLDEFTYLGRLSAYKDVGDDHSVELGVDSAWTPKRTVNADAAGTIQTRANTWRTLNGLDFTYRYQPAQGGLYRGAVWGTEIMQNDERRVDDATLLPTDRVRAYSGFSYVWIKLGPHWRPGILADLTEDLDHARALTKTFSAFLSYDATEFQRLRLVFSEALVNTPGAPRDHTVALQWTGILGRHVHGFRDR